MDELGNLRNAVQELQESVKKLQIDDSAANDVEEDADDIFPIRSLEQLNFFEKKLKEDKVARKKLIRSLVIFGGSTGKSNAKKVTDFLMGHCFDTKLLRVFSFTGLSKNKNIAPKPAFKKYAATIRFLFRIIHRADNSFTIIGFEDYLKGFFKHVCEGLKRRHTLESDEEFNGNEDAPKNSKRMRTESDGNFCHS
ncbi:uncharacterized protein LOC129571626 [Sitodiplosis mosellana]|uniref:uncharacterized protein LOC129571626 n=1 Tax=Sitodiplosis mosellana TaxID=263140 RepID=UPI002444476D|nr:uncharacterized protein LOC129571626 [Sitodiplosis mosellana]